MLKYFFDYYDKIPRELSAGIFTPAYFITLSIIAVAYVLVTILFKNKSIKAKRTLLICLSFALPLLEISRTTWDIYIGKFSVATSLPLHLCGLMSIIMPITILTQKRWLMEFIFASGTIGALCALTYPFVNIYPPIHFLYIQSILVHTTILFIPLLMVNFKMFRPNIRSLPFSFVFLSILASMAHIVNVFFNANFFFTMKPVTNTPLYFLYRYTGYNGYIIVFIAFIVLAWLLLYLPFTIGKKHAENIEEVEKEPESA